MWTRRIASGSKTYPNRDAVIKNLLGRLIEKGVETSWAHFEVVDPRGWFRNLLFGKGVWIEVALIDKSALQLSPGSLPRFPQNNRPPVPSSWPQDKKGMWTVPIVSSNELSEWIERTLVAVAKNENCRVAGWIDGL